MHSRTLLHVGVKLNQSCLHPQKNAQESGEVFDTTTKTKANTLSMEMSRLTRDGTAEPVSRDQILRHARGQGNIIFPVVQLTTSRIGSLTRLIHTLLYVMTIHTYIHTIQIENVARVARTWGALEDNLPYSRQAAWFETPSNIECTVFQANKFFVCAMQYHTPYTINHTSYTIHYTSYTIHHTPFRL